MRSAGRQRPTQRRSASFVGGNAGIFKRHNILDCPIRRISRDLLKRELPAKARPLERLVHACAESPRFVNHRGHKVRTSSTARQGRAAPEGLSRDAAAGYADTLSLVGNLLADLPSGERWCPSLFIPFIVIIAGDLFNNGIDLVTVQKLLGHANVQTIAQDDRRGERAKKKPVGTLQVPYRRRKYLLSVQTTVLTGDSVMDAHRV